LRLQENRSIAGLNNTFRPKIARHFRSPAYLPARRRAAGAV
jgi:hypothetical protein